MSCEGFPLKYLLDHISFSLRFLSASGLGSTRCPPVLVAKRRGTSAELCVPPCVSVDREQHSSSDGGGREREEGGGEGKEGGEEGSSELGEEGMADDDGSVDEVGEMPPSRAVKHKAVEQRRKKKISDGVQQLLETLRPASPCGKMVREREREREAWRENLWAL